MFNAAAEYNPLMARRSNRPARLGLIAAAVTGVAILISAAVSAEPKAPSEPAKPAVETQQAAARTPEKPAKQVRVIPLWKTFATQQQGM